MRNPNGYGSVFKLKGRRRKPWIARVTTGWTDDGRQLFLPVGYFATKQEAMNALVLHRVSPVSPRAGITLAEMYDEWSAGKFRKITKSTENNYRAAWLHLKSLEKAKFADLRTGHWQNVIDMCADEGLSRSSLEKIRVIAVMLCDHAIKNDIVNKNYAKFIELPRAEKTKKDRFTDIEIKQLEKQADAIPWVDTILILIYTGLRISELLSLTRFNVSMEQQVITGGIKTDAGKDRVIPIHPKILKYFRQRYDQGGPALVCDDQGRRLTAKRYREKMYYPALEACGIRQLTPHKCRHTFCSLLAERGADTLSIQRLAGHTDYAFTANEYSHPEIEALRREIGKL
jgi:integrase